MAIAALVISIVGVLVAAIVGGAAWAAANRSANAAEGTERSAAAQAEAGRAQATAAREQLAIERERFHREQAPVLEGSVRRRQAADGRSPGHTLEVRLRKGLPLTYLTLHLPAGTVGRDTMMAQVLGYPEVGSRQIKAGYPAIWHVGVDDGAPASFVAFADCRDEYGRQWRDVEVPVTVEGR
jgi:hypothetical protein